jgi:hypothetical protein
VIERFSDPSRRWNLELLPADDDVRLWDLASLRRNVNPSFGTLLRSAATWLAPRRPLGPRYRALWTFRRRDVWPRRRTFVQVAEWLRELDRGEVDEVWCYSTRHFPLARALAAMTGQPCRELLACCTHYLGELAFELLAVVPYAYWLHRQGRLELTVSTADTRCLYYFSPRHVEQPESRRYVPITEYPVGERGVDQFDRTAFPETLDTSMWEPPPYGDVYRDERFGFAKPLVVLCNKSSDEYGEAPVNGLDVELVLALVGKLRTRYTVVYNRPGASDIVGDHATIRDPGDVAAVEAAYPDVLTIQQLHRRHRELTFNELQLRLFASCERFVSVLGGSSYLASWFGGTNVVYAVRGWEVECGAYGAWFERFSGARVVATATPAELVAAVEREFL